MKIKRFTSIVIALAMLISVCAVDVFASTAESAILTFTDSGITEASAGSGYEIVGTALTITTAGTYRVTGSCAEGSISVGKSLSGVTLILDNLTLTSSSTAPLAVKKGSDVSVHLTGVSTLTDNEDPANETSGDATVAEAFEGAAIKVKSGSSVTFCGDGDLNIVANAKNGIKGGSTSSLVFNQSGTVTVTGSGKYYGGTVSGAAVNNAIACDGSIVFNSGSYVIKATGDGVKSDPDATDASAGTAIDLESAGAITVNGGSFDIDVDGDAFQADTSLTVNGGSFDIQTWKGYSVWNDTLADANSCKGLKAGGDRAEEAELEPVLNVTGGVFTMNTADDALHSAAFINVTGGVFTISTGDDGMHADTKLTLGSEGGLDRDPDVTINNSYEGLEGGTVYIYSGRYYVVASDDGVNAAGGSSNGANPGGPGGPGGFNPWNPGGPGGHGGSSGSSDYNIYIYGGYLYVNCDGDGIDSNGGLYLYGGTQAVFSMRSGGDNSALDADGTVLIDGATVFTAGTTGVDGRVSNGWFGSNQKYSTSTTSYSAGKIINTFAGGSVLMSYSLPRNVNYIIASWPTSVSGSAPSFATATSATACLGGSWSHSWNAGEVTTAASAASAGLMTYTCGKCGATETRTIPATVELAECDHSVEGGDESDAGFAVAFAGDAGVASITVYETQNYSGANESVSADGATVSRSSATGEPDSSGDGQVNFTVVLSDGYALSGVAVTAGTYKNIKGPADTGLANTYRITKITADTTVTITTVQCEHGAVADGTAPIWSWSSKYNSATFSYVCAECGGTVNVDGAVTSELTGAAEITFTATASVGETVYTDTQTAAPFTATFVGEHASVNVYYTQDYSAPDEEDAATAVARDSDSGRPVVSGDGQINLTVAVEDGYELESVTVTGGYKNLKDVSADAGVANTYRITKITGDLTVTVTVKAPAPEIILGDMDGDNEITVGDALTALRIAARLVEETDEALAVGDVDGDGSITVSDALRILRFAAGLIDSFR